MFSSLPKTKKKHNPSFFHDFLDLKYWMDHYCYPRLIVVDIETTGLESYRDLIVEVGIVLLDLSTGEIQPLINQIVQEPGFSIYHHGAAWVFKNSSLSAHEVQEAPLFEDLKPELERLFAEYPATAYNRKFDFGFLRARGVKIPYPLPCPMITATDILRIPHWKFGLKFPSFEETWRYYFPDVHYSEAHRAIDDAIHEAQVIYAMHTENDWDYTKLTDYSHFEFPFKFSSLEMLGKLINTRPTSIFHNRIWRF